MQCSGPRSGLFPYCQVTPDIDWGAKEWGAIVFYGSPCPPTRGDMNWYIFPVGSIPPFYIITWMLVALHILWRGGLIRILRLIVTKVGQDPILDNLCPKGMVPAERHLFGTVITTCYPL
jgi:hypothetical protein